MRTQESIIGNSPALASALDKVSQLALINRPILVMGERGTGKELIAERLHFLSPRWEAPLIKVNCAAMAESLLESELFGHEPGAFTGATRTHRGRFERADGGTLFLDELGTMSQQVQEKVLRLIEYGEFERLGGQETLRVDVRVIGATNADLREEVHQNRFRADLLDRLSFDVVHVPPLRHRPEDIEELAQHFAIGLCAELGRDLFAGFSETALKTLREHPWPGNIRELKNVVERSVYLASEPDDADNNNIDDPPELDAIILDPFESPFTTLSQPTVRVENIEEPTATPALTQMASESFTDTLSRIERELVLEALQNNRNNQRETAEAMGLTYDQLRGLVRKHGLGTRRSQ
ncbi:MAG: phage shock protein operon transcriptional activator [Halioglobus sp.]